jgi:hypothetical protein
MLLPVVLIALGPFTYSEFLSRWKYAVTGDKIVPIIAFGPKKFWKKVFSRTTAKKLLAKPGNTEILPSDGVIFYTDGSLCEGGADAGVFSETLDIRESYALGSLATVFQTEVYANLACSDYCRSPNMHNMTICICSDCKAALLALSSYTISSKLLHQC